MLILMLVGTAQAGEPWNAPYPRVLRESAILFTTFQLSPKHLDPASSYSETEALFTGQIYEPPLQYHYLDRPYRLVPLTLEQLPRPRYLDRDGKVLAGDPPEARVARTVYRLRLKAGIRYAPHPALARDGNGDPLYHALDLTHGPRRARLSDFPIRGTRALVAADYVHQIKRLAHPDRHSPLLGFLGRHIEGLDVLADTLRGLRRAPGEPLDLRRFDLPGARVVDARTYEITLRGKYPQFVYWLAMPFFAPVPWEADAFYDQPGMAANNLTLDWHPLGTGPYMLVENNPNRRMVLARNPEFRGERYPAEGAAGDAARGLLRDANQAMPFIDEIHFMLEREDIPEWNKFLQGYYDTSPLIPDGFDQAVRFDVDGRPELTEEMRARGIALSVSTQMSVSYLGFNMRDPVVGGPGPRARKLRQAISIAVDMEEYISIFGNGRGIPAQGPLPPGIFGYREGPSGVNPVVYSWAGERPQRRSLAEAGRLLEEAGYAAGRDPATGKPLVLYLDATTTGPDMKALFNWYRKQFMRVGIELVVRSSDYNRFQEKMQKGDAQIFTWGWLADYPDPENFLFLLYGPNGKVEHQGENAANYQNPAFDTLFARMRGMNNGPRRQAVIDRMLAIAREDCPWIWGFHPQAYLLEHAWVGNAKPNLMARNTMKYRRLDPALRASRQQSWNEPRTAPLVILLGITAALTLAVIWTLQRGDWRRTA